MCILGRKRGFGFASFPTVLQLIAVSFVCFGHSAIADDSGDDARAALIVVNHNYEHLEKVEPAYRDEAEVRTALQNPRWNYKIESQKDLTADGLRKAWDGFLETLQGDGTALFYFSGHGVSVGEDSYLLGTDLPKGANEASIRQSGLRLNDLFKGFQAKQKELENKNARLKGIFIIDACRVALKDQSGRKSQSFTGGLTPLLPPEGLFVLYAASHGQVAHSKISEGECTDKQQCLPSVFTRKLVDMIKGDDGKLHLQVLARKLRWAVYRAVKDGDRREEQTPDYFDRIIGDGYDIGGTPPKTDTGNHEPVPVAVSQLPREGGSLIWECETCPQLVVIPKAEGFKSRFAMGRSEVTRTQFRAFLTRDRKPCPKGHPVCPDPERKQGKVDNDDKPVTDVDWNTARDYVNWLNDVVKLDPNNAKLGHYRLPSEAEWHFAARGGATTKYVFGDNVVDLCRYANGADLSLKSLFRANRHCDDAFGHGAAQVMSFKPNGFGLHDVHGNVWEWVADCWRDAASVQPGDQVHGTLDQSCRRVARGGSWRTSPEGLTLDASRTSFAQSHGRATVGFRVLREIADAEFVPGQ